VSGEAGGSFPDSHTATMSHWRSELDQATQVVEGIRRSLDHLEVVASAIVAILAKGGCVYACGNGGSALAAQHFTAELVAHYRRDRPPLRGVSLTPDTGLLTAIANDYEFEQIFSRQIQGLATANDALLAFSTSGRSPNILAAVRSARLVGARTIAMTGGDGGKLANLVDHALIVPFTETARVQEGHLILSHLICERIDAAFSGPEGPTA